MMKPALTMAWGVLLLGVTSQFGCSSDDDDDRPGTAGSGGRAGSGHSDAGEGGETHGGSSGNGGSSNGGSSAGEGGAGASEGGTAGGGCVDPPIVPRDTCVDVPSQKEGDEDFVVTSPDFENCGEIPASMTCDGHDFGTGDSPEFSWTGAPEGTLSFAAVFKDLSLSEDPATEHLGYHWAMWDIPAGTTELPGGMSGGFNSVEVPGAHQWSSLGSYGFFTPCPNPFPQGAPQFTCSLNRDSYSFTLYALPVEKLEDLPAPELDDDGMPVSNWVVAMGHYIESLDALSVTEYRGTSSAWAAAFVPPNAEKFPCTQAQIDDAMTESCLAPE